jgi:hypothetical protein
MPRNALGVAVVSAIHVAADAVTSLVGVAVVLVVVTIIVADLRAVISS